MLTLISGLRISVKVYLWEGPLQKVKPGKLAFRRVPTMDTFCSQKKRRLCITHTSHIDPSLSACNDLGDGMPDDNACLLSLLLRQARRNADLQGRRRLPCLFAWVRAICSWEGLEPGDEDAVRETL